uniref:Uncharacterized protein n=1 Tax=Cajanus cajan TaxID=3821 RepID=A0A151SAH7_CAJCA|nr:hypothetical protein KK1_026399 [Cajanus cajan]
MTGAYYGDSSSFCIGNRRCGDNSYVRLVIKSLAGPSSSEFPGFRSKFIRQPIKKAGKSITGRRAKKPQKRESDDKTTESKASATFDKVGSEVIIFHVRPRP